jgi:hypothetical protein
LALLSHGDEALFGQLGKGPLCRTLANAEQAGGFVQAQRKVAVIAAIEARPKLDEDLQG